ncbi:MAG: helix-turn-helix domain-containing protein [Acidobacteriaceae bacterium]|nr:helix-turn-helix domain-containing protein [Acidobacteriaceae bacterium]MBV9675895.1 helix-turn-helix domain-containing protein [Acidobacteriaceae bacterium]
MERARHLLSTTDLPVAEVALKSGFENPSHFSYKFRCIYGLTPVTYRTFH